MIKFGEKFEETLEINGAKTLLLYIDKILEVSQVIITVLNSINMSFWWVNHKQTFRVEVDEGYIWSPQKNNNGSTNQTYINLTKARPGDIIFSYASGKIAAVGRVVTVAQSRERPIEFGSTGNQWDKMGWMVPVRWTLIEKPLFPKEHLDEIVPLLPIKNSPIRADGNGNQSCYLAEISGELGNTLLSLMNLFNFGLSDLLEDMDKDIQESEKEEEIKNSEAPETQIQQLILARKGQGAFRSNVEKIEFKCRITGLADKRFLIAGHIKPWKDSNNKERLDGNNGFLMSPHIDRLFDKGWISFREDGNLLISDKKIMPILEHWFIDPKKSVGTFNLKQKEYLAFHWDHIFKK